jgi:hypothetical protein
MVDAEDYAKIVEAFRQAGSPNVSKVAKATGFSRETVKKALVEGWKAINLHPINGLGLWGNQQSTKLADSDTEPTKLTQLGQNAPISGDLGQNAPQKVSGTQTFPNISDSGAEPKPSTDRVEPAVAALRQEPAYLPVPTSGMDAAQSTITAAASKVLLDEHKALNSLGVVVEGATASLIGAMAALQSSIKRMAKQMDIAAEDGMKNSAPAYTVGMMNELLANVPRLMAANKTLMEMRRKQLGLPEIITEHRSSGGGAEEEAARAARLSHALGAGTSRGRVIDVSPTHYLGEESAEDAPANTGT